MIGANLVYGIPLTGSFGESPRVALAGRLKEWMDSLRQGDIHLYGDGIPDAMARAFFEGHVVSQPTTRSEWCVAGFSVEIERMDDPAYVGQLHSQWDALMSDLEPDLRAALETLGQPKVHMIYGEF